MSPKTTDLTLIVTGGVLIAVLSALTVLVAPPAEEGHARGSTFTSGPAGAKAAFLVLERLGYSVERSFDPITDLTADPARSVLVLASPAEPASEQDRRALLSFLRLGGVVLATGSEGARFLPEVLDDPIERDAFEVRAERYRAVIPSGLAAGVPIIEMASEVTRASPGPAWIAVYGQHDDAVVQTARFGNGRAIWWAGSTPLTNASLGDPGSLDLLLNALGPPGSRTVLWDERYHGYSRTFFSYVRGTPLPWAAMQLGLIGLAAVATYSRRSGPVRARAARARTSTLEFVTTMGGLYERAGARAAAVATAAARLRRLLRAACGLPASASDEQLAQAAAARVPVDAAVLLDVLRASEASVPDPRLSSRGALALVERLQAMAARIEFPGRTAARPTKEQGTTMSARPGQERATP
jgi:hypothetical protein